MPKKKAFRTPKTTTTNKLKVDHNEKVIFGAAVATIGEAKGHGVFLDEMTIMQVEELGNAAKFGVKMRFGHPGMSAEKLGAYLGRAKNFNIEGDRVRADLYIDDTSFDTPNGNLGKYILDMAEKNPDQFGLSMVVDVDHELENPEDEDSRYMLRVKKLYSVDAVDEPAANEGLFSREVQLSAEVSDQFKKFIEMKDSGRKAVEFIKRFCALNDCPEFIDSLTGAWDEFSNNKKKGSESMPLEEIKKLTPEEVALQVKQEREAEKKRISTLYALGKKHNIKDKVIDEWINDGVSLEDACTRLSSLDEIYRKPVQNDVKVGADERDKFNNGVEKSIYFRSGTTNARKLSSEMRGNEFSGISLQALARECLSRDGVPGVNRMSGSQLYSEIIRSAKMNSVAPRGEFSAYPAQGTGDFTNILANVANKVLADGYVEAPTTWRQWCGTGNLSDFKQASINNISAFSDVDEIKENEAATVGSFNDKKETAQLKTYGRIFNLSRQAMINDDMSAFNRAPAAMGSAVARKINKRVYGLIFNDNGDGTDFAGPSLNEISPRALFNTTEGTTPSTHAALSETTLSAAFDAYKSRQALRGDDSRGDPVYLNIRPRFLLIGSGNEVTAHKLLNSLYYSGSSSQTGSEISNIYGPNGSRNLIPIVDVEIDNFDATKTKPWYTVADNMQIGTLTVFFLNGVETPYFDSEPSSIGEADGMKWYIRHDFVAAIEDWRGFYMNQGADAS